MEIGQIKDLKEIATIISLENPESKCNVLNTIGASRAEWTEFLLRCMKVADDGSFRIYGVKDEGKVLGYMAVQNAFLPPAYRTFLILVIAFRGVEEYFQETLNLVRQWASEQGCKNISVFTRDESNKKFLQEFGFVLDEGSFLNLATE